MDRLANLEKTGLIGCLNGTGVTSKNYKDILYLSVGKNHGLG